MGGTASVPSHFCPSHHPSILPTFHPLPLVGWNGGRPSHNSGFSCRVAGSDKEWKHLEPGALFAHRLIGRSRGETARSVEHFREQMDVADGGKEDPRPGENPVHSGVDVALLIERLIPR